jgi:hypothetical protein
MLRVIVIALLVVAVLATFPLLLGGFVLFGLWRLVRRN